MYEFRLKFHWSFFPRCPINYIRALVQIMAWRRPGYKQLSESKMVSLLTHICVTRPQWVKYWRPQLAEIYGIEYTKRNKIHALKDANQSKQVKLMICYTCDVSIVKFALSKVIVSHWLFNIKSALRLAFDFALVLVYILIDGPVLYSPRW